MEPYAPSMLIFFCTSAYLMSYTSINKYEGICFVFFFLLVFVPSQEDKFYLIFWIYT